MNVLVWKLSDWLQANKWRGEVLYSKYSGFHLIGLSGSVKQLSLSTHYYITYSVFTLATSEPWQTGLVSFSKADISRTTGTWQVPVVLLISAFENETKPVWHGSEVASVNALLMNHFLVWVLGLHRQPISRKSD